MKWREFVVRIAHRHLVRHPRWQGRAVSPLLRVIGNHRLLAFEKLLGLEYALRRLLGQPLSIRQWDRMTFNDKVTFRRLIVHDPLMQTFSDKLAMRTYVTSRLGEESVPKLLKVDDYVSAFVELPGPYVLKPNHGSGMVTVVGEGQFLSSKQQLEAESWLNVDYCWEEREWGYVGARQLLLAEEFLHGEDTSEPPPDYKLFTFEGKVEIVQVSMDRFAEFHWELRRPDWSLVFDSRASNRNHQPSRSVPPVHLDSMLETASTLGRGIDFVRVDMFDVDGGVLIGELTTYPWGGNLKFRLKGLDRLLGQCWNSTPSGMDSTSADSN